MNVFDFFRRKAERNEVKEEIIKKLIFSEIEKWIEKETLEKKGKEKDVIFLIKEKNLHFNNKIKEKIILLKKFDLKLKKERERVINIVNNNRNIYIEFLEKLIEKLNNMEETDLEKLIEIINDIFSDFNKKSFKSYERTTYLIGKEMLNIKTSLALFSKDILEIFDENKFLINFSKDILIIKKEMSLIISIDENLNNINKNESNLAKKIEEKENKKKDLNRNLEETKNDSAYLKNLDKRKEIGILKETLERDISRLKQIIDFKSLASFFHINSKKMNIIKDYREHFRANFEKDNGEIIIELLTEAEPGNDSIIEEIKEINMKRMKMKNEDEKLDEDEIEKISSEIKRIDYEIEKIKADNDKEEKRYEKLERNREESIKKLKESLKTLNVELI